MGHVIDGSLSDRNSSVELADKLLAGLTTIDRSHFTGTQKLWILQHLLIPWIQWPLLIYEVPISSTFKLEQKVSFFIRKWRYRSLQHLNWNRMSLSSFVSGYISIIQHQAFVFIHQHLLAHYQSKTYQEESLSIYF